MRDGLQADQMNLTYMSDRLIYPGLQDVSLVDGFRWVC